MAITQAEQAARLITALHALDERARLIASTTDADAFDWTPADGGWSVGQIFEHLCVANDSYLAVLRRVIPSSAATRRSGNAVVWRPTLVGRMLARSMESPRKLPAPKMWRPAPAPRPNVVDEFLERQREIALLIERSLASEWRRLRMASPVSPLLRMNLGDAFTILVRHAERHVRQIDARRAAYRALADRPQYR